MFCPIRGKGRLTPSGTIYSTNARSLIVSNLKLTADYTDETDLKQNLKHGKLNHAALRQTKSWAHCRCTSLRQGYGPAG